MGKSSNTRPQKIVRSDGVEQVYNVRTDEDGNADARKASGVAAADLPPLALAIKPDIDIPEMPADLLIATDPNSTAADLQPLFDNGDKAAQMAAAAHPNASEAQLLSALDKRREPRVAKEAAGNPSATPAVLKEAYKGHDRVKRAALSNPSAPPDLLARALKRKDSLYRTAVACLLYTSPSPRDATLSRMPSSA